MVVDTGFRAVVVLLLEDDDEVRLTELVVVVVRGVVDVERDVADALGSVYVLVEVLSEEEYDEDVPRELLFRIPVEREDVPSARALRSFFILCAFTPALVASTGAAKILITEAQSIAKKQAPRDGLQPSNLYTLMEER